MIKFIDVEATMQTSGIPIPNKIIWDSGKVYEIDKVLEIKKRASTKGGGAGLRYLVKLKNQERYLFLNNYKWFIELD